VHSPPRRSDARLLAEPVHRLEVHGALTQPQRLRRALSLLLLTAVLPGAAQLSFGNRRAGRIAVRSWALLWLSVIALAAGWFLARRLVLTVLTQPLLLSLAAGVLILLGAIWPVLVADAWRLGQAGMVGARARRRVTGLAVVLMLLTSLPLFAAGRRVWAAGDLIGSVFGSGRTSASQDGRYNVLLLGGDAGADRVGVRPDSVTLASIDAHTGRTVLVGLPRNLENVPFPAGSQAATVLPQGWSCGDACLLNSIYQWGTGHPTLFPDAPDPGAEAMKQAVSAVTGLEVNYYVLIDLAGFRKLIDAMGGVRLTVGSPVPIGGGTSRVSGYIKPGTYTLDGYHALWYARSRHGSSDYERMARQRCVMTAMVNQLDPTTVLARFQAIAGASKDVVSTDIPASELPRFLQLGTQAKSARITSLQFVPPLIVPSHPDLGLIRRKVKAAIETSRQAAGQALPADSGSPAAGSSGAAAARPAAPTSGATGAGTRTASSSPAGDSTGDRSPSPASTEPAVDVRSVCQA
jgi:polyisoprenyl-teichoic acid--peptidoglycan teichoic acid transferase